VQCSSVHPGYKETTTHARSSDQPSDVSFGTAVITPRWLYVLAAATPPSFGDPVLTDETLEQVDLDRVEAGDMVGIGIHTANALRGYTIGKMAPWVPT
jgi:hypothetical protein